MLPCEVKIHQRGVQWKQGVVMYMMLCTSLLYDTTPIHCTPLPLHPPLMNTHMRPCEGHQGGRRAAGEGPRSALANLTIVSNDNYNHDY